MPRPAMAEDVVPNALLGYTPTARPFVVTGMESPGLYVGMLFRNAGDSGMAHGMKYMNWYAQDDELEVPDA